MPQIILQDPLLDRNLRSKIQVLHATSSAGPKIGAARCGAIDRGFNQLMKFGFGKTRFLTRDGVGHALGGQCSPNKKYFAALFIGLPCNTLCIEIQRVNRDDRRCFWHPCFRTHSDLDGC